MALESVAYQTMALVGLFLDRICRLRQQLVPGGVSGPNHDNLEHLSANDAVEIGGHRTPTPFDSAVGEARTVRRYQDVGQLVERVFRRPPLRVVSRGFTRPHVDRGASKPAVF